MATQSSRARQSRRRAGRDDRSEVVLRHRLGPKLDELNPELPAAALDAAVEELVRPLRDGPRPRQPGGRGSCCVTASRSRSRRTTADVLRRRSAFVDWSTPANNDFLAVSQFWVVGPLHTRRWDIVCFVNGIPLVLLELKASHKSVEQAYRKNLRDYRDTIPQLFTPNASSILSNGSETKVGSTFAAVGAVR